ncbi:MAG: PAS domain-containing sensor histidine kinase [Sumerlaeia bacterium]
MMEGQQSTQENVLMDHDSIEFIQKDAREIGRVKRARTRLVISIPALLFTFTLLICLIVRFNILEFADTVPDSKLRQELFTLGEFTLWSGLAASFAAGGVGILIAWQILRPLGDLLQTIQKVAQGNLTERADIEKFTELGTLGSAFNNMVENLHSLFEQRNRQLRDAAAGTVITVDGYGNILAADKGLKKITGIDADRILGMHIVTFFEERFRRKDEENIAKSVREALQNAQKGLTSTQTIALQQRDSDQLMRLSIRVTSLETTSLTSPSAVFDIRDLSTLKGFFDQIHQADRLAALGTLAAGIAHEVRNPLGAIKGMTQLIQEDLKQNSEEQQSHLPTLERISNECDRLDKIVSGIMDFARNEPGLTKLTCINRRLQEAYDLARHKVDFKDNEFPTVTWKLDQSLPEIPLESNRILQAYLNIIINALEELRNQPNGQLTIKSFLDERHKRRQLSVEIINTGGPIPKDQLEKIFEPFYTTKAGGTGLGLPIAYQAIITNNGVMEIESRNGTIIVRTRFPFRGKESPNIDGSSTIIPKLNVKPAATLTRRNNPTEGKHP